MSTEVSTQKTEPAIGTNLGRAEDLSLWEHILGLLKQDLAERRGGKFVVEVQEGEFGSSYEKKIEELSASERRCLPSVLPENVAGRLLERYLAEQGRVDLLERRRA